MCLNKILPEFCPTTGFYCNTNKNTNAKSLHVKILIIHHLMSLIILLKKINKSLILAYNVQNKIPKHYSLHAVY